MKSLEIMKKEISLQVSEISKIKKLPKINNFNKCIIVGSGDSYVAGLIFSYLTNFDSVCIDPADLIINPSISKDKIVYIISISGKTKQNILVAQKIKKYCKQTIAITSNPDSQLARNCDRVINLNYKNLDTPTSGTLSFIISMVTCVYLLQGSYSISNIKKIYEKSKRKAKVLVSKTKCSSTSHENNSIIFLGNSILYPIAMYGSLKVNEVLGWKSFAYSLENFCHAPLFQITENDSVIILSSKRHSLYEKEKKLVRSLKKRMIETFMIEIPDYKDIKILLMATFIVQLFIIGLAKKLGLENCNFLENTEMLKISSELIYDTSRRKKTSF